MTDGVQWLDLIATQDLEDRWVTRVHSGARVLAVYDTPTGYYVTTALCSHAGADLCDGYFDRHLIECPLHQAAFDVRSGMPIGAPATRPLRSYPCRVQEGMLQIEIRSK